MHLVYLGQMVVILYWTQLLLRVAVAAEIVPLMALVAVQVAVVLVVGRQPTQTAVLGLLVKAIVVGMVTALRVVGLMVVAVVVLEQLVELPTQPMLAMAVMGCQAVSQVLL